MTTGKLTLHNGQSFEGKAFGARTNMAGEVVFSTAMVGYPEALTDPSFKGQILVLTYPLAGNYGVPPSTKDDFGIDRFFESSTVQISGLIVSDYVAAHSHWNAKKSLGDWLAEHNIPGLYGVDTRELTQLLRDNGSTLGKITTSGDCAFDDPNARNLAAEVSIKEPVLYKNGPKTVIVIDVGCKHNIVRNLLKRGFTVKKVPWDYDFTKEHYDGLLVSNGPGDPKQCEETIANVRAAYKIGKPIFGICLGSQIMGLAAGANTYKLKFGHRGQNQPCVLRGSKRCYITTQNHGYAIDHATLPESWEQYFYNLNDRSNEGIIHKTKPFMATQFHPEANPGPDDTEFVFDSFAQAIAEAHP